MWQGTDREMSGLPVVLSLGPGPTAVGTLGPRPLWPHWLPRHTFSLSFPHGSERGPPLPRSAPKAVGPEARAGDALPRHVGPAVYLRPYKTPSGTSQSASGEIQDLNRGLLAGDFSSSGNQNLLNFRNSDNYSHRWCLWKTDSMGLKTCEAHEWSILILPTQPCKMRVITTVYTDEEAEVQQSPRVTQPVNGRAGVPPRTVLLTPTRYHSIPITSPTGRHDLLPVQIRTRSSARPAQLYQALCSPLQSPFPPLYCTLNFLVFHKKNRQMGGRGR